MASDRMPFISASSFAIAVPRSPSPNPPSVSSYVYAGGPDRSEAPIVWRKKLKSALFSPSEVRSSRSSWDRASDGSALITVTVASVTVPPNPATVCLWPASVSSIVRFQGESPPEPGPTTGASTEVSL